MLHATLRQDFTQYHEDLEIQGSLHQALMRVEELYEAQVQQKPV